MTPSTPALDAEYEVKPAPDTAPGAARIPVTILAILLGGPAMAAIVAAPLAPFVWLLCVAVGNAPMTWGGLLTTWLGVAAGFVLLTIIGVGIAGAGSVRVWWRRPRP
jgi:hypothetical protein